MLPTLFNYDGQGVRTVIVDGEPWFVAKDVCEILELSNSRMALERVSNTMKGVSIIDTLGGKQEMSIINEPGVWKLAFTSRRPEAEKFTDWLAEEVIPSIRKTGSYSLQPYKMPTSFPEALRMLADAEEEKLLLLPKAEYFDALVERNLLTNFRDTAKELKIKEQIFINWLIEKSYIYRDATKKLKPYAQYVPNLFEIKESKGSKWAGNQTLITPKGRETFRLLLQQRVGA